MQLRLGVAVLGGGGEVTEAVADRLRHAAAKQGHLDSIYNMGVLALLNEECIRPKGSDAAFVAKVRVGDDGDDGDDVSSRHHVGGHVAEVRVGDDGDDDGDRT